MQQKATEEEINNTAAELGIRIPAEQLGEYSAHLNRQLEGFDVLSVPCADGDEPDLSGLVERR